MNVIDCFAVNKLLDSEHDDIRRIGRILFDCDGTLNKDEIDEIAVLISTITVVEENAYRKGFECGYDDGRGECCCCC